MSRLRAEFLYEVGHLWVCAEALGASATFERDGLQVEITMPSERAQFDARIPNERLSGAALTGTTAGGLDGVDQFFEVRLVSVALRGDSAISRTDFPTDGPTEETSRRVMDFFAHAQAVADSALADFIDWARIWGESWLGVHRQVPPQIGAQLLYDDETDLPLPIRRSTPFVSHPRPIIGLTAEDFDHVARHLGAGEEPDLARVLLADAVFLASEAHSDPGRAVLTAAIALEVRVKEVLREAAKPDTAPLVDLMLDNPRDWPQPAAALFDKAMAAVTGRSLRVEEREVYKAVDLLFQARNAIAHHGKLPSAQKAREFVDMARVAFAWLGSVDSDAWYEQTKDQTDPN
jgi:hypothetical protein